MSMSKRWCCSYRVASALGIPFMEINGVPLRINPMQLKNAFVTPQALMKKLSQHLYFQVSPFPEYGPERGCAAAMLLSSRPHMHASHKRPCCCPCCTMLGAFHADAARSELVPSWPCQGTS